MVWARRSSQSVLTLVQSAVCSSLLLGQGFYFCLLLGFFWCPVIFFSSMGLGRRPFRGRQPKGKLWSCQEGRRLGLANPQMNGAPSLPPPPPTMPLTHSVKEPGQLLPQTLSPRVPWVCSCHTHLCCCLPWLCHHLVPREEQTLEAGWARRGHPCEGRFPVFGSSQSLYWTPGLHTVQLAPSGSEPLCFRSVTRVPTLEGASP